MKPISLGSVGSNPCMPNALLVPIHMIEECDKEISFWLYLALYTIAYYIGMGLMKGPNLQLLGMSSSEGAHLYLFGYDRSSITADLGMASYTSSWFCSQEANDNRVFYVYLTYF